MSCPTELELSVHVDGETPAEARAALEQHLRACPRCRDLATALERENASLQRALAEDPALEVARLPDPARPAVVAPWLWPALAAAALSPLLLPWAAASLPALPRSMEWLGEALPRLARGLLLDRLLNLLFEGGHMIPTLFLTGAVGVATLMLLASPALRGRLAAGAAASVALLLGVALASPAAAYVMRDDEDAIRIPATERIDESALLAGRSVEVEGGVSGDLVAFAQSVILSGEIEGDVYTAAEEVEIRGHVSGNLHAAGRVVRLLGTVDGSVYAVGEDVTLAAQGAVGRDLTAAAATVNVHGAVRRDLVFAGSNVAIAGQVGRHARGHAARAQLRGDGAVAGDLRLTVPDKQRVQIDDPSKVGGATSIELSDWEEAEEEGVSDTLFWALVRVASGLLLVLLLASLLPRALPRRPDSSGAVLRHLGVGFLVAVATPVAALLLCLTVLGLPLGLLTLVVYGVTCYVALFITAYLVGGLLLPPRPGSLGRLALATLVGLVLVIGLGALPLLGGVVTFLATIFGLGALAQHLYRAAKQAPAA